MANAIQTLNEIILRFAYCSRYHLYSRTNVLYGKVRGRLSRRGFRLLFNELNCCSVNKPYLQSSKGIHTYIIGHYSPLIRTTTQHLTPLMLCALILYMSGGIYNLKSTSNERFLCNISCQFLFTFRALARNLLRERAAKIFFHISFCWRCLTCEFEPRSHIS